MNFLLGVSITINLFLTIILYLIFKFRKVLLFYEKFKNKRNDINGEIVDFESMLDFLDSDRL